MSSYSPQRKTSRGPASRSNHTSQHPIPHGSKPFLQSLPALAARADTRRSISVLGATKGSEIQGTLTHACVAGIGASIAALAARRTLQYGNCHGGNAVPLHHDVATPIRPRLVTVTMLGPRPLDAADQLVELDRRIANIVRKVADDF